MSASRPEPETVRKHILLVEDDPVSLKLMRDALAACGFDTEEVTNGLDVLPSVAKTRADVIVLDIGLPGLDGVQVTRQLKAMPETRDIPIVVVTAYAMPGDEQRVRNAGCNVYLTKPLSFANFLSIVRSLLRDQPR